MALLKSALEEPLLSRQQAAVLRDIARAAQLSQGLTELNKMEEALFEPSSSEKGHKMLQPLKSYIGSEIERVLMQIKLPKQASGDQV